VNPKDLEVGKKYIWFGSVQTDVLEYRLKPLVLGNDATYTFMIVASTAIWETCGLRTCLDSTAIEFTFPYDNLWQFCNLLFNFRKGNKRYKLEP